MDLTVLDRYGIDSQEGIARCMGDEELYAGVLGMFLQDDAFQRAKAAHDGGDMQMLFRCVHELKGACGNVAMTELYDTVDALVEYLRGGQYELATVDAMFARLEIAYLRAREGVACALGA